MSRISSDPRGPGRPDRQFRRYYAVVVAVLGVACAILLGLGWFQGPKLQDAVVDAVAATERPAEQLRLFVNQAVMPIEAEQLTVTPSTPASVSADGDMIVVQFDAALLNDTEYTVEVDGVVSEFHDQPSTVTYAFSTPQASAFYLDRADPYEGGADLVKTVNLSAGRVETVFSAEGIQSFAVTGHVMAVQIRGDGTTDGLSLVNLVDGVVEPVSMPVPGTISGLRASAGFIAFTLTDANPVETSEYLSTLVNVDLSGAHEVVPARGLDGAKLGVSGWRFIPGTTEVLALGVEGSLLRIDLAGISPTVPLGSFGMLGNVSPDGAKAVVGTAFQSVELSLADGSQQPFLSPSVNGQDSFAGEAWPLNGQDARVQKVTNYDFGSNLAESFVVLDDGLEPRVLYETGGVEGIDAVSVSPNGQYIAVEVFPSGSAAQSDGYYPDARPVDVVTRVFDAASGRLVRELTGFGVDWSRPLS